MKTLIALALFPLSVFAANTHEIEQQGVKVTLTDEACGFKEVAHILPYRATWTEKNKVFEGCFVVEQRTAYVVFPEDMSTVAIPLGAFKKVNSA